MPSYNPKGHKISKNTGDGGLWSVSAQQLRKKKQMEKFYHSWEVTACGA